MQAVRVIALTATVALADPHKAKGVREIPKCAPFKLRIRPSHHPELRGSRCRLTAGLTALSASAQ